MLLPELQSSALPYARGEEHESNRRGERLSGAWRALISGASDADEVIVQRLHFIHPEIVIGVALELFQPFEADARALRDLPQRQIALRK